MVVIFDLNTGEFDEPEGSKTVPEEHLNIPLPEYDTTAQLREAESIATMQEQSLPPLLHQEDVDSFLHLMEAKFKQSR